MMRHRTIALAGVLVLAVVAGPVSAQQSAPNPHGPLPRGLDCSDCHTAASWKPAHLPPDFDHRKWSGFALDGRHASVSCRGCHLDLKFDAPRIAQDDCASCHADFHHGQFAQACGECHNATSFADVPAIRIHAQSGFPLTGAHLQVSCQSCHYDARGGNYQNLDRQCIACHRKEFETVKSIDHVAQGFPTTCLQCHDTRAWADAPAFDHAMTGFPLVGAHVRLRCGSCHIQPGNALKFAPSGPNDCIACHQADFERAHDNRGFPTTCLDCHTIDSFHGASFDHDGKFFPIFSGAHQGRWNACTDCHQAAPSDYSSFTCTSGGCHARGETDARHQEVRNYVYDSQACYACHASGRGGD
ncbi:MAG: hypothetical protein Q8W51_13870 [Candidatus Palauibacterales bacterium]|nr:hypothetical protein [Candidatus Palauibacterales bacterium]MDP2530809.1 hypothetical protein [Candidatus Palauibacterales bacterium]MDP2583117.1 hypothetical protein [Candidatus Palauibacterales bacterium]